MQKSKRFLIGAAACACAALGPVSPAFAQRVVVFGDSLSDSGNAFLASGGTNPNSPLGRFSNGYNWADLLYGTNPTLGFLPGAPTTGYVNYAFGGACTGNGNNVTGCTGSSPPGISQEIALFASKGGTFAASDTATIWGGANNGFVALANPAATQTTIGAAAGASVSAEIANIQSLLALGAKKVIVMNLPDLGSTPALNGSATTASAGSFYSSAFNSGLSTGLTGLKAATSGVSIVQVDVAKLFSLVVANPAAFGFTNVTTACGFKGGAACSGVLFGDSVHPTQAAYAYVAQLVGLLSDPSAALGQMGRIADSQVYANEQITNAVFGRLTNFVSGTYADKNGPYVELLGSYSTYDADGGTPGITMQLGGFRAGIDKKSGATLAGASLGLMDGSVSAGATKSDLITYRFDAYGTALFGNAFVSVDAGITGTSYSNIVRDTGIPTVQAKGDTTGWIATASAEAGFVTQMGNFQIIPSGRVTYLHSKFSGFDEAADLLAMSFADRDTDAVLLGGKVRAVTNVPGIGLASTAFGEIGYEGYVYSSSGAITANFVNNTTLPTTVASRDLTGPGIVGKLGVSSQVTQGTFLDFQYGLSVHDGGGQTHAGDIRLKATY